jgi:hypothetical protein
MSEFFKNSDIYGRSTAGHVFAALTGMIYNGGEARPYKKPIFQIIRVDYIDALAGLPTPAGFICQSKFHHWHSRNQPGSTRIYGPSTTDPH